MRLERKVLLASLVIFGMLVGANRAVASTILITSEGGIANDGLLDWGVLGANLTVVASPFTTAVPGIGGMTITGSEDIDASFERRDEVSFFWGGNFGAGEELLWTRGPNGPMDFSFNSPISGFGAQIQADFYGAFTGRIEAFDGANVSLGFFTLDGNSTDNRDDSAIFIGILSNLGDIRRVQLGVPGAEDFAVNSPRIQAAPVPEPVSMLLLGTGLVGAAVRRYRRRA